MQRHMGTAGAGGKVEKADCEHEFTICNNTYTIYPNKSTFPPHTVYFTLPVSSMPVKGVFDDFDAYSHGTHFSSGSKMTKSAATSEIYGNTAGLIVIFPKLKHAQMAVQGLIPTVRRDVSRPMIPLGASVTGFDFSSAL